MLATAASLLGATHVLAVDCDVDAIHNAQENVDSFDPPLCIDFILDTVHVSSNAPDASGGGGATAAAAVPPALRRCAQRRAFDTVVLNPPFGTKKFKGADMAFLRAATSLVCSLLLAPPHLAAPRVARRVHSSSAAFCNRRNKGRTRRSCHFASQIVDAHAHAAHGTTAVAQRHCTSGRRDAL